MNGKVFIDTNIIIYSYSSTEPEKQLVAQKIIAENNSYISTQVLAELSNIMLKKFGVNHSAMIDVLHECYQNHNVYINAPETIEKAIQISDRYRFSFYDSLILSSAISTECEILYSEDLHNGQIIDNKLTILNPF